MKKTFIAIGVNSLEKSIRFYEKILNFELEKRISPANDIEIAWLKMRMIL